MAERTQSTPVVEVARQYFLNLVEHVRKEYPRVGFYPDHVHEVERWALKILTDHPEADSEVVLLGVWFHDSGNLVGDKNIDHAIRSEEYTRLILSNEKFSTEKLNVAPQTLEARIVAAADSASHMTGDAYVPSSGMKRTITSSLGKLDRDYRDIALIPGLQEKLTPLYEAWKTLLSLYPKFD